MNRPNLQRVRDRIAAATGGRPMTLVAHEFSDVVSGRAVFSWRDRVGRFWLAEHRWALFRVPCAPAPLSAQDADAGEGRPDREGEGG